MRFEVFNKTHNVNILLTVREPLFLLSGLMSEIEVNMKRNALNYWIDLGILISFILTFVTGIIKWPGLIPLIGLDYQKVPMLQLMYIHDFAGVAMGLLSVAHVLLHIKWVIMMTKKIFLKRYDKK